MAITGQGLTVLRDNALTDTSATAEAPLGSIRVETDGTYGEKVFIYVKAISAVSAYAPVIFSGASAYNVTQTAVTANLGKDCAAGVAANAISSGSYGWIQVRGHAAHILTGAGSSGNQCTSANTECIMGSNGVMSFRKLTLTSGSTSIILAGIRAHSKVGEASSTSGYIHVM